MMRASVLRWSAFLQINSFTATNITFCRLRWLKCGVNSVSTLSNSDILYHTGTLLNAHCSEANERTFCTNLKTGQDVARFIVMRNLKQNRHSYFFWRSTSSSQHVNSDNDNSPRETITHSPHDNLERDLTPAASEDNVLDAEESSNNLPEMSRRVYNLAPYVEKSETLQNLVKLGVNLSRVEKVKGIANMLMMSEFDRDVLPYLRHLVHVGVTVDKLGYILTVNPLILTEHIEHLEQRVGYLLSEDFTLDDVASMYTRAPVMILMDPVKLDKKLAFLQQAFDLTGQEVRQVALRFPKILPWKREKIAKIRFNLKEFMGFEDDELN